MMDTMTRKQHRDRYERLQADRQFPRDWPAPEPQQVRLPGTLQAVDDMDADYQRRIAEPRA